MTAGRSRIVENTFSLAASGAGSAVFAVVQLGVLSRSLQGELFGLFVALRGFSLLLGTVMLLGLPQVMIRFLPSYQSRGGRRRALILFTGSTVVVLLIGYALYAGAAVWDAWMPRMGGALAQPDRIDYWVLLASCALAVKMLLYGGFNGMREMRMQMILELLYQGLLTVFIFVFRERLDVTLLFQAMFTLNTLAFLAGVPVFIRIVRRLIPAGGVPQSGKMILPPMAPYWIGSVLLSIVALAFTDVDRYVMTAVLPLGAISIFHVSSRINNLIRRFLGIPILAAQPEITRIYEEGRWKELASKIGLFTKGTIVASLFFSALVAVIGRDAIFLLSGARYIAAYPVLMVLLATIPMAAVIAPLLATMRSLHYMRWAVLCDFIWMTVYFGTFFVFVGWWGVIGMAVAQTAASIVQMTAAVLLSKREGFYGGVGAKLGRVLGAVVVLVPLGILATGRFGLPVSVLCLALSPFAAKYLLKWLSVFEGNERKLIVDLIPVPVFRRTAAWMLSTGE